MVNGETWCPALLQFEHKCLERWRLLIKVPEVTSRQMLLTSIPFSETTVRQQSMPDPVSAVLTQRALDVAFELVDLVILETGRRTPLPPPFQVLNACSVVVKRTDCLWVRLWIQLLLNQANAFVEVPQCLLNRHRFLTFDPVLFLRQQGFAIAQLAQNSRTPW